MLVEAPPNLWPVALALLLGRRGRPTWQCPHSAEGDMLALKEGSGFEPTADIVWIEIPHRSSVLPRRDVLSLFRRQRPATALLAG
jgi:hypothetical protein